MPDGGVSSVMVRSETLTVAYFLFGLLCFVMWFIGYTDRWGLFGRLTPEGSEIKYGPLLHLVVLMGSLLFWPVLVLWMSFQDGNETEGESR